MAEGLRADARAVTRVVGTGAAVRDRVTERVRALRDLGHPAVLAPTDVRVVEHDQVVVTSPWVDGVDLAELESRRGPLTAGECVWLGVRVAAALDAMHAQGLAHGDVAPGNVVITNGEVMLVDTVGGCLDDERGTVGFRSPERRGGATPAGDAYSLGALLRWCAAAEDTVPLEAWTAPLMVVDPALRPPVEIAARALRSCASPCEVAVPARSEVVSAVRARAVERTERIAAGRPWRIRRAAMRVAMSAVVAAIAVGVVIAAPRAVDAAIPPGDAQTVTSPSAGTSDSGSRALAHADAKEPAARPSPAEPAGPAAADLTTRRIEALAAGDGAALLSMTGDGPLAAPTAELAAELDAGRIRYEGLSVDILHVDVTAVDTDTATTVVEYEVTDHSIVSADGVADVAGYGQRVELDLSWDGQWSVVRARPAP